MNDSDRKDSPPPARVVVDFPHNKPEITPEEQKRRALAIAQDLARADRPAGEWLLYVEGAAKKLDMSRAELEAAVKAIIKQREKDEQAAKAAQRQLEQRVEKERTANLRKAERQQKEEKRETERADREAERKQREREEALEAIAKCPLAEREPRLVELARRRGEDLEFLRRELKDFIEAESRIIAGTDSSRAPWPDHVDAKALLKDVLAEIRRYVVIDDEVAITVALWTLFAWVHNEIAVHSPNLILTSAEPESGKTTLTGVLQWLTPRPFLVTMPTVASVYYAVENLHPTLLLDNAEKLFKRRPELVDVIDAGWTRGKPVPRVERGVLRLRDAFCAKVINMRGLNLVDTTASRAIVCTLWPKLPHEQVDEFGHADDETFQVLRRKLARWRDDNLTILKNASPVQPPGFDNRIAQNWKLLLAIAELAGVGKQARAAAVRLAGKSALPSPGVRLVRALKPIFTETFFPSEDMAKQLAADLTAEWCDYDNRGPISQKQIATLLAPYGIHPQRNRVPGRPRTAAPIHGYLLADFANTFARFAADIPAPGTHEVKKRPKTRHKVKKACTG
jgi:Protein of unknown function (DUF3631)